MDGGISAYLTNRLADLVGRLFVESDGKRVAVRFGVQVFGRRLIQKEVPLKAIESVEWSTGQATSMAGRDMNDWQVCLWFYHSDPEKRERQKHFRKPDQEIYIIGPSGPKDRTAALGTAFVNFLLASGAELVPATESSFLACCYRIWLHRGHPTAEQIQKAYEHYKKPPR